MTGDAADCTAFLAGLAESVGADLLSRSGDRDLDTTRKSDRSWVTEADLLADRLIADAIMAAYPQDTIVSEELSPRHRPGSGNVWIVDPIDGTSNFAVGLPLWGIAIARVVDGLLESAVVRFPALDETFLARRGCGATLNGEPIRVRGPVDGKPAGFFVCCSRAPRGYRINVPMKTRMLGACSYTLCSVARGVGALAFESTPKVWDLAAPMLIVEEAGGVTLPLAGPAVLPLDPEIDYRTRSFPYIAAATPVLARSALEQIEPL